MADLSRMNGTSGQPRKIAMLTMKKLQINSEGMVGHLKKKWQAYLELQNYVIGMLAKQEGMVDLTSRNDRLTPKEF